MAQQQKINELNNEFQEIIENIQSDSVIIKKEITMKKISQLHQKLIKYLDYSIYTKVTYE